MAKPKTQAVRFSVSVTETQWRALQALMAQDMSMNVSQYVGQMIAEVTRRRSDERHRLKA